MGRANTEWDYGIVWFYNAVGDYGLSPPQGCSHMTNQNKTTVDNEHKWSFYRNILQRNALSIPMYQLRGSPIIFFFKKRQIEELKILLLNTEDQTASHP